MRTRSGSVPPRAEYCRADSERRALRSVGIAVPRRTRRRGPQSAPRAAHSARARATSPPRAAVASARVRPPLQTMAVARGSLVSRQILNKFNP